MAGISDGALADREVMGVDENEDDDERGVGDGELVITRSRGVCFERLGELELPLTEEPEPEEAMEILNEGVGDADAILDPFPVLALFNDIVSFCMAPEVPKD